MSESESSSSSRQSSPLYDNEFPITPDSNHYGSEDGQDESTGVKNKAGESNKKRKSWGQELPTPTTNLPPRKRAKTEAEKEQRRIERVIRNRKAAHASRERKRHEQEQLHSAKEVMLSENTLLKKHCAALESNNSILESFILANFGKLPVGYKSIPAFKLYSTNLKSTPKSKTVAMADLQAFTPSPTIDSPLDAVIGTFDSPKTLNTTQHHAKMLCSTTTSRKGSKQSAKKDLQCLLRAKTESSVPSTPPPQHQPSTPPTSIFSSLMKPVSWLVSSSTKTGTSSAT